MNESVECLQDEKMNSEQMKNAAAESSTVLGMVVGEDRWLVQTTEVNEVLPVPKLLPVALTQPWFLGIANVRGHLYGIVDLAQYFGGAPTQCGIKARLLLASPRFRINSGLLVSNMLGVRSLSEFEPIENEGMDMQAGIAGNCRDKGGRRWRVLNFGELVREEAFLQIAI